MSLPFDRRFVAPCLWRENCIDPSDPTNTSDPRCLDPQFALDHPEICGPPGTQPRLIIKPEAVSRCTDEPVQFETFLVSNGAEEQITNGLTYISSNQNVVLVGGLMGGATVVGEGIATVTVTWQNLSASAQVTGLGTSCCDDQNVGMVLALDNSQSMGQAFSGTYATRFILAKELANNVAAELNTTKDKMAVISFNDAANLELDLSDDVSAIQTAIASIGLTANKTNLFDALERAIEVANADTTLERKVVVLFSDGENKEGEDPYDLANEFKSAGGIIIVVGLRASGAGFTLLNYIASGGFFLNATEDNEDDIPDYLQGLKGYFCAGNCVPEGDEIIHLGKLNFDEFINWDVDTEVGPVDLIGGDPPHQFYDFLPGNGLYVDLNGSSSPWQGIMDSKTTFAFAPGDYSLRVSLAGNQRQSGLDGTVVVNIDGLLDQGITITDWKQDFTDYTFNFTVVAPVNKKIHIESTLSDNRESFGLLLGEVELRNTTTDTQIFFDDFDEDGPVYVAPGCGEAEVPYGYTEEHHGIWRFIPSNPDAGGVTAYGYDCYGSGCLTEPIPPQAPDPSPLPDLE
jgi:hypothetical protein